MLICIFHKTTSDRTEYSAYAERCRDDTELGSGLSKEAIESMSFNEFAETTQHKWINSRVHRVACWMKLRSENSEQEMLIVDTGGWHSAGEDVIHVQAQCCIQLQPSIMNLWNMARLPHTHTTFFDLPIEKRHQLNRSYYELVMYVPWKNTRQYISVRKCSINPCWQQHTCRDRLQTQFATFWGIL